jgi:hypothetical protein
MFGPWPRVGHRDPKHGEGFKEPRLREGFRVDGLEAEIPRQGADSLLGRGIVTTEEHGGPLISEAGVRHVLRPIVLKA